jgi:hypothetical protein
MLTSVEVMGKCVCVCVSAEHWAEIRRPHWAEIRRPYRAERMPIKVIARVLGSSNNMVRKALAADGRPSYRR